MKARDHTDGMLHWWTLAEIDLADLAIRRQNGEMIWHHEIPLQDLALPWARAENARKADVYIRPARKHSWPVVFLDDVQANIADRIAKKYDCLVVHTSPEGGCHIWLRCDSALDENQRRQAQRWLTEKVDADPASTSGEHLGRLAGFKNWKRTVWVNLRHSVLENHKWTPCLANQPHTKSSRYQRIGHTYPDTSESGREWGWICGMLEAGCSPSIVYHALVDKARSRRGTDTERYARRSIAQASAHVAISMTTKDPREISAKTV